jgi:anti-sigma regulatory factor (Ser/Thr protein kinase)
VLSIDAWAQDALALLSARPGVRRVGLALIEGGGRRLRFTSSESDPPAAMEWCHVDAYDDIPLNAALRSRTMVVGALDELAGRFAEYVAHQRETTTTVAMATVLLEAAEHPVGGYVLFFDRPQTFDEAHREELATLGRELGAGLRRAQRGEARRTVVPLLEDPADHTSDAAALAAEHQVDAEPAAVAGARRFLRRTLHDWDVAEDDADTAVLCLSELVTNAVIHSHAGCAIRVRLQDGLLTATVRDTGPADTTSMAPLEDPLQVHGRGLKVVEALTQRWGYELDTEGTTVWFELAV